MQSRPQHPTGPVQLVHELDQVEEEVCALATRTRSEPRLLELAAREYEILELLSRPWRRAGHA